MTKEAQNYSSKSIRDLLSGVSETDYKKVEAKMQIAAMIEDGIEAKGWKKKELAVALNKKQSEITRWLSGTHNFTLETLVDIEHVLGVSLLNYHKENKRIDYKTIHVHVPVAHDVPFPYNPAASIQDVMRWETGLYANSYEHEETKESSIDIQFQLKSIELLGFSIESPETVPHETKGFNFNINTEHKLNKENRFIAVITTVEIIHDDGKTKLAEIKTNCIFNIKDISSMLQEGSLPIQYSPSLNQISYSTTRGMAYSLLKDTYLHNAFLPVVDPWAFSASGK